MNIYSFMLAAVLLNGAPDGPDTPDPALFHEARFGIQVLAVEWEIIDRREVRYMMIRAEDFSYDLNTVRRRNVALRDAPLVADSLRFPDRTIVNEYLALNRNYKTWLEVQMVIDRVRWLDIKNASIETDILYKTWDLVRDARCEHYYVTVRRQALLDLRKRIGPADYYAVNLPPYVPLEYYSRMVIVPAPPLDLPPGPVFEELPYPQEDCPLPEG